MIFRETQIQVNSMTRSRDKFSQPEKLKFSDFLYMQYKVWIPRNPHFEFQPCILSKQTRRYQTVAGNRVFSVLSSDPMGGSYPWVHVPWPIKFGPRATHGLAGACLHFSPLPKVIFSGALSQPFWIAESWFLLRNFWHYNLPRIWYDISSNQKFCILRFSTLWNTFKKNFI